MPIFTVHFFEAYLWDLFDFRQNFRILVNRFEAGIMDLTEVRRPVCLKVHFDARKFSLRICCFAIRQDQYTLLLAVVVFAVADQVIATIRVDNVVAETIGETSAPSKLGDTIIDLV